jgi:hypothetical protein
MRILTRPPKKEGARRPPGIRVYSCLFRSVRAAQAERFLHPDAADSLRGVRSMKVHAQPKRPASPQKSSRAEIRAILGGRIVTGVPNVGITAPDSLMVSVPVVARIFSSGWALNTL